MEPSRNEPTPRGERAPPPSAASDLCELVASLVVADEAGAIAALELAAQMGGADAALFVWVIPEDDEHFWYRSIAALDHGWGASALRRMHAGPCKLAGLCSVIERAVLIHESITGRSRMAAMILNSPPPQFGQCAIGSSVLGSTARRRIRPPRTDGLQDAVLADVVGEFVELGFGELCAWVGGIFPRAPRSGGSRAGHGRRRRHVRLAMARTRRLGRACRRR
jgi:hypothetical protein